MHTPALLKEAIEALNIKPNGLYIDATYGLGGHSEEIIKQGGKVLGIDWAKVPYRINKSLELVVGNFAEIEKIAKDNNFYPVDGVLFDLGISMEQIENSGKGFSYRKMDDPLDMRISDDNEMTAKDILNNFDDKNLFEVFAKNSEDINSRIIAENVVVSRKFNRIEKVKDLIRVIDKTLSNKSKNTYARIFQALRIEVNNELENLKNGLAGAIKITKKNGRIAVITFHSIEDRLVKQFIKKNNLRQINKKVIRSDNKNNFEKSAKLRIIEI